MRNLRVVFVLLLLITGYFVVNRIFKVGYSSGNVVVLDSLRIGDSVTIGRSFAVLGRNYKGYIEATIIPEKEHRFEDFGVVEYYYMRFGPNWYEKHITPRVIKQMQRGDKLAADLIKTAKVAHEDNFHYCCHFNDYPIINEGLAFARISVLGAAEKVTILAN